MKNLGIDWIASEFVGEGAKNVMILWHSNTWILRREEKPTRCHWMVYCTYDMLNIFRGLLCPSPGARDYMCVITSYGVQCCKGEKL